MMSKHAISVPAIPAVGPYSQAVEMGKLLFCSGQIPLDPQTGRVETTDIGAATEQALKNLQTILAAAGLGMDHIVKTTVYLTNMDHFPAMNDTYSRYFTGDFPARATVAVAALPKGAPVEIEAIAMRP